MKSSSFAVVRQQGSLSDTRKSFGIVLVVATLLLLTLLAGRTDAAQTLQKNFVNLTPEWSGWVIANDTTTPSGRIYFNWDINMKRIDSQMVTGGADWQTTIWDYNTATITTLTPDGTCRQTPLMKAPGLPESLYTPEIKSKFVNYTVFNDELVSYSTFKTPSGEVGVYTDVFVGNIVRIVSDKNTNELFQGVVVAPQDLELFLIPSIYGACDGSAATQPKTRPAVPAAFEAWVSSSVNKNINGSLYVDWLKGVLRFDQMQSGAFSLTLADQSTQSTKTVVANNNNQAFICTTTAVDQSQTGYSGLLSSTVIGQLPAILTPTGVSLDTTLQWQGIKSIYGHLCNWWTYVESVSADNFTVTTTVYEDVFTQDIVLIESGTLLYSNFALLTNQFYLFSLPSEWDCTGEDVSEETAQYVQYPEWTLALSGAKANQKLYVDAIHKLLRTDRLDLASGVLTIQITDYNQEMQWFVTTAPNEAPTCNESDEDITNSSFIAPTRSESGWEWEGLAVVDGRLCNEWNDSIGAVILFEEVTTGELIRLINQTNKAAFDTVSYTEGEVNLRYFSLPAELGDEADGNCNLSKLNSGSKGVKGGWVFFIAIVMLLLGSVLGLVAARYVAHRPAHYQGPAHLNEPLLNP